jgi:hypothetical protein
LNQLGADASRIAGEKCDGGMSHVKIWVEELIDSSQTIAQ